MPTCPKCGKLISDSKYARHLRRCGGHRRRTVRPVDSDPGAYYMKM